MKENEQAVSEHWEHLQIESHLPSQSSHDKCEFWWKRFSNMSWVLVNCFPQVRRKVIVTVLKLIDTPSSSDEKLVDEDVQERANGGWLICRWETRHI